MTALAFGSLMIELGAPVALLSARLGWLWALGALGMHWGIYAVMGILFWYPMLGLGFAAFVVDERLVSWLDWWRADLVKRISTPVAADDNDLAEARRSYADRDGAVPYPG